MVAIYEYCRQSAFDRGIMILKSPCSKFTCAYSKAKVQTLNQLFRLSDACCNMRVSVCLYPFDTITSLSLLKLSLKMNHSSHIQDGGGTDCLVPTTHHANPPHPTVPVPCHALHIIDSIYILHQAAHSTVVQYVGCYLYCLYYPHQHLNYSSNAE